MAWKSKQKRKVKKIDLSIPQDERDLFDAIQLISTAADQACLSSQIKLCTANVVLKNRLSRLQENRR